MVPWIASCFTAKDPDSILIRELRSCKPQNTAKKEREQSTCWAERWSPFRLRSWQESPAVTHRASRRRCSFNELMEVCPLSLETTDRELGWLLEVSPQGAVTSSNHPLDSSFSTEVLEQLDIHVQKPHKPQAQNTFCVIPWQQVLLVVPTLSGFAWTAASTRLLCL